MSGDRTAVDARDESLPNSDIANYEDDATVLSDKDAKCQWNGVEFPDGASVCAEGVPYECQLGKWMKMPGGC